VHPLLGRSLVKPAVNEAKRGSGCTHHFGYLTGFSKNVPMPEECLTCRDMLECRNVSSQPNSLPRVSDLDYIHVKIGESSHNETHAYLMFVAGIVLLVGGLLETVITVEDPDWFLLFPYKFALGTYRQWAYARLGLFMVFCGFWLLGLGIILGISSWYDGKLYMNQLNEVYKTKRSKESNPSHIRQEPIIPSARKLMAGKNEELDKCVNHLTVKMGFSEDDAVWYCRYLGPHWREL